MKQNIKITLSGMMIALSVITMLLSYYPYLTYAIPAATGLFMMVLVIEIDCKWAFSAYFVSSVLVFIFAEPESKLMYICLFGYYPILKSIIERINKPVIEWIFKLIVFNIAVLAVYMLLSKAFDISIDDFDALGKYGAYLFLGFGNIVFVIYDIAVSRMAMVYMRLIHPKLTKLFKINH